MFVMNRRFGVGEKCGVCPEGQVMDRGVCIQKIHYIKNYDLLPSLSQNDYQGCIPAVGCGVTSLAMALSYHGVNKNPSTIAQENGGCYMNWLIGFHSNNTLGIEYLAAGKETLYPYIRQQIDNSNPVIAWTGDMYPAVGTHFVVVYGYDKNGFYINDPAGRTTTYVPFDGKVTFGTARAVYKL